MTDIYNESFKIFAKLQSINITHIPKAEIKKMLDAGDKFEGVDLVEYKNLQIK